MIIWGDIIADFVPEFCVSSVKISIIGFSGSLKNIVYQLNRDKSMETKSQWRKYFRQARKQLSRTQRQIAERQTQAFLSRFIRRGKRIAIYYPIGSEMQLNQLHKIAKQRGAQLYLPYIETGKLRLWFTPMPDNARVRAERQRGTGSLRIPQYAGKKIRAHQLDTMLIPIVGIDRHGYRLGQGGGYYDVTLAAAQRSGLPQTVAVGFACQFCSQLPHEPHDKPLDYFVCEKGVMKF